ncbi:MAG: hypothetical protein NDI69_14235 [Bacteriovoracaceae bacterium]|nr:hypothetical protein [Bacteriovoracaceae bacterium]
MKNFFFLYLVLLLNQVEASSIASCPQNMIRVWTQSVGYSCVTKFNPVEQDPFCAYPNPLGVNPFQYFPGPLYQAAVMPAWAHQGHLLYPNVGYPGAWSFPGIESRYYPGEGAVFAAKPNVYVESIHNDKKFNFKFISRNKPHFLATTPVLDKTLSWSGKIREKDKFEIEDVFYDYLFYDLRLPKEKMQFSNGLCSTREGAIEWMLKDLKEMKYSEIAQQDFEEHWRVKIPDYPYYCIYPQYNRELDPIIPVEINLDQTIFIRSLYVLVPHRKVPDMDDPQEVPLPGKDPSEFRPGSKIQRENMFREWGVAFLGY